MRLKEEVVAVWRLTWPPTKRGTSPALRSSSTAACYAKPAAPEICESRPKAIELVVGAHRLCGRVSDLLFERRA